LGTSPFIWKEERLPELPFERKMNIQRIFVNKKEMIQKRQKIWQKYQKDIVKGKKFIDDSLEPGDSVFLYRPRQSKMQNGWQNGFKVIKGIGHDAFLVEKDGQIKRTNKKTFEEGSNAEKGGVWTATSQPRYFR
ncbi:transposable element, partial [Pseudoloma neurophilia]